MTNVPFNCLDWMHGLLQRHRGWGRGRSRTNNRELTRGEKQTFYERDINVAVLRDRLEIIFIIYAQFWTFPGSLRRSRLCSGVVPSLSPPQTDWHELGSLDGGKKWLILGGVITRSLSLSLSLPDYPLTTNLVICHCYRQLSEYIVVLLVLLLT